jgi:MGT family glycosyltransferase
MTSLGNELLNRGHQVTVVGVPDAQAKAKASGLDFQPVGASEFPLGSVAEFLKHLGEMSGFAALLYTINQYKKGAMVSFREGTEVIKGAGIDALLIDQSIFEGGTIAEYLKIPFITVCNAIILNSDPVVPPAHLPWDYHSEWWAYLRNQMGYTAMGLLAFQIGSVIEAQRQSWGLPKYPNPECMWSDLAQISQQPVEFEFPRTQLPRCFHFAGPFINSKIREKVDFPFDKLTGKPLIYASLGTVQNRLSWIFNEIAKACADLDVQLVLSLGGSLQSELFSSLPGNPIVVNFAPQLDLIQKAALTITHAGINTTLESLSYGVPLVAIPIANDQPGIASRINWTGTGKVIQLHELHGSRLRDAISMVLNEKTYTDNAQRLRIAISRSGGVMLAANIVEQAVMTGESMLN